MTNAILDLMPILADQKWTVRGGYIRNHNGQCPVCALASEIDSSYVDKVSLMSALAILGHVDGDVVEVAAASDRTNARIRAELEFALGIGK